MNAITEQASLQGLADQQRADARRPMSLEELAMDAADAGPISDIEILDALVEMFDLTPHEMIERLICMDFVTLRSELP